MGDLSVLQSIWLVAIVALWGLYLVLEGFDFGAGMLLRRVRRDHVDRRVALHAIGPTWAANEVWVIVAVVGMFGAFPGWYAAWASGLYLPLAVALLAIVARNAGIELLGKREDERWRRGWETVVVVSSTVAPFCWGLAWAATIHGLALRGEDVTGSPLDVVSWYSVLGGLVLVALCRVQGAAFLALRTGEGVRERALRELTLSAPIAALLGIAFLALTASEHSPSTTGAVALAACAAALLALLALGQRARRAEARAVEAGAAEAGAGRSAGPVFAAASAAIALLVVAWFVVLFPDAIAARGDGAGLALADVAAGDYTLTLMAVLAGLFVPLLLAAQAWTYWTFRHRVTRADAGEPHPSPVDLVARLTGGSDDTLPRGPGFRLGRRSP